MSNPAKISRRIDSIKRSDSPKNPVFWRPQSFWAASTFNKGVLRSKWWRLEIKLERLAQPKLKRLAPRIYKMPWTHPKPAIGCSQCPLNNLFYPILLYADLSASTKHALALLFSPNGIVLDDLCVAFPFLVVIWWSCLKRSVLAECGVLLPLLSFLTKHQ